MHHDIETKISLKPIYIVSQVWDAYRQRATYYSLSFILEIGNNIYKLNVQKKTLLVEFYYSSTLCYEINVPLVT